MRKLRNFLINLFLNLIKMGVGIFYVATNLKVIGKKSSYTVTYEKYTIN